MNKKIELASDKLLRQVKIKQIVTKHLKLKKISSTDLVLVKGFPKAIP